MSGGELVAHFGGPDLAPGRLRDLLAERTAAVPAGGAIDFVTYYFRDRRLAEELLRARRRGVAVQVTLEGRPRTPRANAAVVDLLSGPAGLAGGLRLVQSRLDGTPLGRVFRPRLHEKLYCFSHPRPTALLGSFNPSGDLPEEQPEIVEEIRDQDRGHNVLVELARGELVGPLVEHARRLHRAPHGPLDRLAPRANRALRADRLEIHFWPRVLPNPVLGLLRRLGPGARVRLAASHLSGPSALRALLGLAARGVVLEILTESTERRVPPAAERRLSAAGISIRRVAHPQGLPMHAKFALVEAPGRRCVIFGSFNWTEPSRRFNREIGAICADAKLFDAFAERWGALEGQLEQRSPPGNEHRA